MTYKWLRGCISFALISIGFLLCGCQESKDVDLTIGNPDVDSVAFSSEEVLISCDEDSSVCALFAVENDTCMIVKTHVDENTLKYSAIVIDGKTDKEVRSVDLDVPGYKLMSFCYAGDGKIACSRSTRGFVIMSLEDGSLVYDGREYISRDRIPAVSSADDGFVLVTDSEIVLLSSEGKERKKVSYDEEIDEIPLSNCFFSSCGRDYVALSRDIKIVFYEVDLDHGEMTEIANEEDLGLEWAELFGYGKYAYDQFDCVIYEVDPYTHQKAACAYTSNFLIQPESGSVMGSGMYLLDRNRYAMVRQYNGSMIGIQIIRPDPEIDLNSREKIIVKGDYASFDNVLALAAYRYNTSQDEYFVVIQSYGDEYGYETTEQANERTLRLIQDFQQGDAPDIFYGNTFDYNYMGENGLVLDLKDRIDSGELLDISALSDNLEDLFYYKGHCYQVFGGYSMFGLYGDAVLAGTRDDMSLYDDSSFAQSVRGRYTSGDIANFIIGYPIRTLIGDDGINCSDELENILDIAVRCGISPEEQMAGTVMIDNDNTMLTDIGSLSTFSSISVSRGRALHYFGLPTVGSCFYAANPKSLVAISSGSKYPDACVDFLSYLYSDEAQRAYLYNGALPVTESALAGYLDYMDDPDTIPDDDLAMKALVPSYDPGLLRGIDQAEIENEYKKAVRSVNGLLIFDWGVHLIISEEVNSYFLQDRDIELIAQTLLNRLELYVKENY